MTHKGLEADFRPQKENQLGECLNAGLASLLDFACAETTTAADGGSAGGGRVLMVAGGRNQRCRTELKCHVDRLNRRLWPTFAKFLDAAVRPVEAAIRALRSIPHVQTTTSRQSDPSIAVAIPPDNG